jgi:hypothetical protein
MLFIFLLTFFCVNIGFRARSRGLNPTPWIFSTVLAVLGGIMVSAIVISITWMRQYGKLSQQQMMDMMERGEIALNNWNLWFVMVCAFGGYLLIRYMVDKRGTPPKKNEGDELPPQ